MECSHIYSSLDQTARKINIGKFTHGKCSVLIVTDLAARGIDIPLLDNVINYSFPAKAKLFLHRVGEFWRPCSKPGALCVLIYEVALCLMLPSLVNSDSVFLGSGC